MENKKWAMAALISSITVLLIFVFLLFFVWGTQYFLIDFSFVRMILPLLLFFFFCLPLFRVMIWAWDREKYLRDGAKNGTRIDAVVVDGLPNIAKGLVVSIEITEEALVITQQFSKATAQVLFSKITAIEELSETYLIEQSKNAAGRAVVGGLLTGTVSVSVSVSTATAAEKKHTSLTTDFLIINYLSGGEDKVLSFSINKNIIRGLSKFVANAKIKANIIEQQIIQAPIPKDISL